MVDLLKKLTKGTEAIHQVFPGKTGQGRSKCEQYSETENGRELFSLRLSPVRQMPIHNNTINWLGFLRGDRQTPATRLRRTRQ